MPLRAARTPGKSISRLKCQGAALPRPDELYARRMADVLPLVEARLRTALGEPDARAAVTFLGTDRIEVLRFQEGDIVRYATLGMSAHPMADPTAVVADPVKGPRAELVLSVRAGVTDTDKVLRPLAVLAASPQVEGVVVAPGASLDGGEPLWPGARRAPRPGELPAAAPDDAERGRLEACARRPGPPGALADARDGPAGPHPRVRPADVSDLTNRWPESVS